MRLLAGVLPAGPGEPAQQCSHGACVLLEQLSAAARRRCCAPAATACDEEWATTSHERCAARAAVGLCGALPLVPKAASSRASAPSAVSGYSALPRSRSRSRRAPSVAMASCYIASPSATCCRPCPPVPRTRRTPRCISPRSLVVKLQGRRPGACRTRSGYSPVWACDGALPYLSTRAQLSRPD